MSESSASDSANPPDQPPYQPELFDLFEHDLPSRLEGKLKQRAERLFIGGTALRDAINEARQPSNEIEQKWNQESFGSVPETLTFEEMKRFEGFVGSAVKNSPQFVGLVEDQVGRYVKGRERLVEEVRPLYRGRGISQDPAAKPGEYAGGARAVERRRQILLKQQTEILDQLAQRLSKTNDLVNSILPGYISQTKPPGELRVRGVMPKLSHQQGVKLMDQLDEGAFDTIYSGYYQMLNLSNLPAGTGERRAKRSLDQAIAGRNDQFVWLALFGARTYYAQLYRGIEKVHQTTEWSDARSITDEAKTQQINEWRENRAGRQTTKQPNKRIPGEAAQVDQLQLPGGRSTRSEEYDTRGTLWDPEVQERRRHADEDF